MTLPPMAMNTVCRCSGTAGPTRTSRGARSSAFPTAPRWRSSSTGHQTSRTLGSPSLSGQISHPGGGEGIFVAACLFCITTMRITTMKYTSGAWKCFVFTTHGYDEPTTTSCKISIPLPKIVPMRFEAADGLVGRTQVERYVLPEGSVPPRVQSAGLLHRQRRATRLAQRA